MRNSKSLNNSFETNFSWRNVDWWPNGICWVNRVDWSLSATDSCMKNRHIWSFQYIILDFQSFQEDCQAKKNPPRIHGRMICVYCCNVKRTHYSFNLRGFSSDLHEAPFRSITFDSILTFLIWKKAGLIFREFGCPKHELLIKQRSGIHWFRRKANKNVKYSYLGSTFDT